MKRLAKVKATKVKLLAFIQPLGDRTKYSREYGEKIPIFRAALLNWTEHWVPNMVLADVGPDKLLRHPALNADEA